MDKLHTVLDSKYEKSWLSTAMAVTLIRRAETGRTVFNEPTYSEERFPLFVKFIKKTEDRENKKSSSVIIESCSKVNSISFDDKILFKGIEYSIAKITDRIFLSTGTVIQQLELERGLL